MDSVFGLAPDPVADASVDRVVAVIHAQASALAWVHETTGTYPALRPVCEAVAGGGGQASRHLDRLGQSAKHHPADPALAARLLGLDAAALLRAEQGSTDLSEGTTLGALFEHLAALSVEVDDGKFPQRRADRRYRGERDR